uniref:succinylglutamate desuccinylase/aspartoacylase domain-containing protein n=1 Tax=Ningiella ruwaisensis TaxID=2364274 RepID=UPI0010A0A1E2|nr:succinylglutamate desuccinylase/aspartoacylase family protein [Ningiella ruwaisensis]
MAEHHLSHQNFPTLEKTHIAVAQNASGRSLNVPIYRLKGHSNDSSKALKVYIQSSIHGAEVQGNVVIYHLLQSLLKLPICGEVLLVPNCNPVGTNIKAGEYTLGRFDPVNGTNWNRGYYYDENEVVKFAHSVEESQSPQMIKQAFRAQYKEKIQAKLNQEWGLGLAQQLNLKLQQLAFDADIVLDLHNGPVSSRHIYIPEYAKEAAYLFSFAHNIFIPNVFAGALDEATFCPWWTLGDALQSKGFSAADFGVEAFTVEMGSQEVIDFAEGKKDADNILSYLQARGLFAENDNFEHTNKQAIERFGVSLADYKTLFTDFGGMVEYCAKPGHPLKKGDLMARVLNIDELDSTNAVFELKAPCDLIPILHFPSASVLSGTQLYKCFTNYKKL